MKQSRVSTLVALLLLSLSFVYLVNLSITFAEPNTTTETYLPQIANRSNGSSADFPSDLAIASPFDAESTGGSPDVRSTNPLTGNWQPAQLAKAATLRGVLNQSRPLTATLQPMSFFTGGSNANCYGPNLDYTDHPDGSLPNSGQLPSGDLGIWLETESSGEACAPAQIGARMADVSDQTEASLILLAGMIAVANQNSLSLPSGGGSLDLATEMNAAGLSGVQFYTATIQYDSATNVWSYDANFDVDNSGVTQTIEVHLEHGAIDTTHYSGKLSYLIDSETNGGNCGSGPQDITINGSLAYSRTAETEMKIQARTGSFCGHGVSGLDRYILDPAESWSDNFSILTAEYDPTNLSGMYAYAWQAGNMDRYSRVLNIEINDNTPLDGEAYFGFGDRVQVDADGSIGISGFFCNWAGPGPGGPGDSGRFHEYAQRQFVSFNSTSGYFEQPVGGDDLRFAPTVDCTYDGSGSFWYDRDLSGTVNESAVDLEVTGGVTGTLDLMEPLDGSDADADPTIEEAIDARGFTLPAVP